MNKDEICAIHFPPPMENRGHDARRRLMNSHRNYKLDGDRGELSAHLGNLAPILAKKVVNLVPLCRAPKDLIEEEPKLPYVSDFSCICTPNVIMMHKLSIVASSLSFC